MSNVIKIRKGLDIKLVGEAEKTLTEFTADSYALKPPDFLGLIPKLLVKEGDEVKAGTPVFCDKANESIVFASPVAGTVSEIVRGARRLLLEVRIKKSEQDAWVDFGKGNPSTLSAEEITKKMVQSGVWALLRQRPYSIIAKPYSQPKAIVVSAFDTAPLAPDYDFIVHGHGLEFQTGLDALAKLSSGKIHLNCNQAMGSSKVFANSKGVQINYFSGPHPAGNPGIQIHHLDPINKGDVVWYLRPQEVIAIGRLFTEGRYNVSKIVALTGSEAKSPKYYKMYAGACIRQLVSGRVNEGEVRYISGNVLTGSSIDKSGYLGFYDNQLTLLPEGKYHEFFGWALPGFGKFSFSGTFPTKLFKGTKFKLDTNTHGSERAFVMSGQYDRVLPMDIYPVHLLKAILADDVELMEKLGIYEVDEEDFALCEVICTSKIEVQALIRRGLDLVRAEMS